MILDNRMNEVKVQNDSGSLTCGVCGCMCTVIKQVIHHFRPPYN